MPEIVQPKGWKPPKGYSNGVLARGEQLYIAGQIGWNAEQTFERHDFMGQAEQALRNVVAVVEAAGGRPENLVRMTWYVTDKAAYVEHQKQLGEIYRRTLGRHFPAMTMVVVRSLIEDAALVEIEATAVI